MGRFLFLVWQVAACLAVVLPVAAAESLPLDNIRLPPGFSIELLVRVPNARAMALGDNRVLYVGSMHEGKVYGVELDGAWKAKATHVLASGLKMPVGVAWRDGDLYVSAVDRILRLEGVGKHLDSPPKPVTVTDRFPSETHHGWKFIAFGPDGRLYVPVGAPCNICEPDPDRYAAIFRMNPDGSDLEIVARGVRNTVGFDWHPETRELWFTDNGRDLLGDDLPPDELNRVAKAGQHFGYPYCHGGTIADDQFGSKRSCGEFVPPVQNLGAHVAALGMRFYTGKQFPEAYRNQVFIAEHGSWNRSKKSGYRVSLVRLQGNRAVSYEPFATGWLQGEKAWGRPVDVLVLPDGSLLVSDDDAGAIYRIRYHAAQPSTKAKP
ncbi:MAG TPA: sorbosone dehydrogenase family protein [Rhodocyclaceae bacterium]|nr:sorbosone dehydrogenase family protein [Rhodocyclaceae bacterium]